MAQDLWGVAPSTTEGDDATETGMGIGTSNDALATIKSLKQRVEWLEESIGRLLVPPPFLPFSYPTIPNIFHSLRKNPPPPPASPEIEITAA